MTNDNTRTAGRPRCYYCGGVIDRLEEGSIEIADQEIGPPFTRTPITVFNEHGGREEVGALCWPSTAHAFAGAWRRVAFVAHMSCPEHGYWLPLERLDEDWECHLSRKRWWFIGINELLDDTRQRFGAKVKHVHCKHEAPP